MPGPILFSWIDQHKDIYKHKRGDRRSPLCFFIQRLYVEADRAKAVIAADHCGLGIFHPPIIEILTAVGKSHYEGGHAFPCTVAHAIRLLPAVCDPNLAFPDGAGMLHWIFVFFYQIRIVCFSNRGNFYLFHQKTS